MPRNLTILVFGANGQVGARLVQACAARGIAYVALTRAEYDLAAYDERRLRALIESHSPTHIINATAYTAVDQAESEHELANIINAQAVKQLADMAASQHVPLIHLSTDYVFDGLRGAPYAEDAPTHPLNVYASSKLAGEQAALAAGATVFRLQWVYDIYRSNFFLRMRELLASRESLSFVADQVGAPSFAKHVAIALLDALHVPAGLYHLTAAGFTSRHGLACAIHAAMPQPMATSILPVATTEFPVPAQRPLDTRLATDKLAALGITLPHWQDGLREAMEELHAID